MAYREVGWSTCERSCGGGWPATACGASPGRWGWTARPSPSTCDWPTRPESSAGAPRRARTKSSACRRPGRPAAPTEPSAEVRALVAHQEMIRRWLSEDALRLTKVYRRLRALGVDVSYSTLYRFARAQCDFAPAAITVRVAEAPPGEAAEVDFGLLGLWLDPLTGQRRRVYGLLITLCFSRYAFLWANRRLPAEEKQLLQVASVIGKDVPFSLRQAIAALPEEVLRRDLTHLQAAEFLSERSLITAPPRGT